jgi:hypothetical protein
MTTNLITSENQSYMSYRILNMIDKINYLDSISEMMMMFEYQTENIETNVFAFLLKESQMFNDNFKF